jgi:hypothetical protein
MRGPSSCATCTGSATTPNPMPMGVGVSIIAAPRERIRQHAARVAQLQLDPMHAAPQFRDTGESSTSRCGTAFDVIFDQQLIRVQCPAAPCTFLPDSAGSYRARPNRESGVLGPRLQQACPCPARRTKRRPHFAQFSPSITTALCAAVQGCRWRSPLGHTRRTGLTNTAASCSSPEAQRVCVRMRGQGSGQ